MKKWKTIYLIIAVVFFIILMIPFFQNVGYSSMVIFFKMSSFTSIYMPFMFMCMIEWALITLYLHSLLTDVARQDPTKFDLK